MKSKSYSLIRSAMLPILGMAMLEAIASVPSLDLISLALSSSQPALAQDAEESTNIQIYQQAAPAVVSIRAGATTGSGSIISPDGLVLTTADVVRDSQTVTVMLADGKEAQATVVGFAEAGIDLAAIQLQEQHGLPTIPLARPESVAVGQRTFAIGNPFGQFQGTFTLGVISRIDENRNLIQTDAAINPGDEGGPLLNSSGELIGITTSAFNPGQTSGNNGISFAVSVRQIEAFLVALREGRAPRVAQNPFTVNIQSITPDGNAIEGELTATSNILPSDNSYFNSYSFEGKAGQQVTIEMTSSDFDAYLILVALNSRDAIQDDNSGGGTNAQITAILPEDGTYIILANSSNSGATGRYRLSVKIENGSSQSIGFYSLGQ